MSNRQRELALKRLKSYTPEDAKLSGLPDPQAQHIDISPDTLALWEKDFYNKLVNDREYWETRRQAKLQPDPIILIQTPQSYQLQESPARPLFAWTRCIVNLLSTLMQPILHTITKGDRHDQSVNSQEVTRPTRLSDSEVLSYHVRHHRRKTSRCR